MRPSEKAYYDRRAPEYDDWWEGTGLFERRARPGWHDEVRQLQHTLAQFPPCRVLDVGCGTGFLTQHLAGTITGVDQSARMVDIARSRVPSANFVQCSVPPLPFPDKGFDRVVTAHFYGHLGVHERQAFLVEARRVAGELVIVDSSLERGGVAPEEFQQRTLSDGSRHEVYKRYFTPESLVEEIGDGSVLMAGRWFVVIAASLKATCARTTTSTGAASGGVDATRAG